MLETARLIVGLLPILMDMIKTIEIAIPEKGEGTAKLAAVREMLIALVPAVQAAWPAVELVINALVKLFNAVGTFQHE